jgi:hypothetical protein
VGKGGGGFFYYTPLGAVFFFLCTFAAALTVWFHVVFLLRTHGIPDFLVFLFEDGGALVCVRCGYLQVGDITVLVRNISHVNLGMRGVCYVLLTFFGTVSLLKPPGKTT